MKLDIDLEEAILIKWLKMKLNIQLRHQRVEVKNIVKVGKIDENSYISTWKWWSRKSRVNLKGIL